MPKCSRSSILILCPTVRLKKYTIVCFLTGRLLERLGRGVSVQMSKCYCIHSYLPQVINFFCRCLILKKCNINFYHAAKSFCIVKVRQT